MEARVHRFYYEELEEIIENINDKISELNDIKKISDYEKDKLIALINLVADLNNL